MNILITGGAGYLGSIVTPHLLNKGHEVTVLDNFLFRQNSLADCCHYESFNVVRGDCRDASILKNLLKDADIIIPLAAMVGAPLCDQDKLAAESVNHSAVKLICDLVSPDQRIIIPITNSGYGVGEEGKFCTEETPLRPISLYGKTKVDAEKEVLSRDNSISFRLATVLAWPHACGLIYW